MKFDDLLIIAGDLSRKVEVIYTEAATMKESSNAILWWKSRFGLAKILP